MNAETEYYLYQDGLNPVALLNQRFELVHHYVYGTRSNVPEYFLDYSADRSNPTTYRILSDHLGSPRLVVDAGDPSIIVHKMRHDEFGRVEQDTITAAGQSAGYRRIPFGFAGGLYDPKTDLVRFGARDYDPQVGRWTSKDPILFGGGDLNLYGYTFSDPINYFDRDGLALAYSSEGVDVAKSLGVLGAYVVDRIFGTNYLQDVFDWEPVSYQNTTEGICSTPTPTTTPSSASSNRATISPPSDRDYLLNRREDCSFSTSFNRLVRRDPRFGISWIRAWVVAVYKNVANVRTDLLNRIYAEQESCQN